MSVVICDRCEKSIDTDYDCEVYVASDWTRWFCFACVDSDESLLSELELENND